MTRPTPLARRPDRTTESRRLAIDVGQSSSSSSPHYGVRRMIMVRSGRAKTPVVPTAQSVPPGVTAIPCNRLLELRLLGLAMKLSATAATEARELASDPRSGLFTTCQSPAKEGAPLKRKRTTGSKRNLSIPPLSGTAALPRHPYFVTASLRDPVVVWANCPQRRRALA